MSPTAGYWPERQRDVLGDRALHQERLGAIRGHVHDAGADRVGRMAKCRRRAVEEQTHRRSGGSEPDKDVEELVLALTFEGDNPKHFARVELERNIIELRPEHTGSRAVMRGT